jgi:hypothetical protein
MDIFESIYPLIHISLQLYPLIPTSRGFPRPWLIAYRKTHPRTAKRSFTLLFSCLLWIKKVRAKDKTYEWGSVRWEIHECDGRAHDPDTMVVPLTPKPTRKAGALVRVTTTIALCREEDAALRKWPLLRYCCATCILETKTKVGSTTAKAPVLRTNPKIDEEPTTPKPPTHPSHPETPRQSTPSSSLGSTSSPFWVVVVVYYKSKTRVKESM